VENENGILVMCTTDPMEDIRAFVQWKRKMAFWLNSSSFSEMAAHDKPGRVTHHWHAST
jgi:hypothetical protein